MRRLAAWNRPLLLVLGTGYILFFFSERLFWSFWRPGDEIAAIVGGWLLYCLLGYVLLAVVAASRVRSIWALVLAGAVFGWLGEGVFAMTLFGDPSMPFPLTLAWTGLAWHMPISVLVGLVALRRALQAPSPWPGLAWSSAIGLFWGFWAVAWGLETPPLVAEAGPFLLHAALATFGLALAQIAVTRGDPASFVPGRFGLALSAVLILAFLGVVTVPAIPWSPLVLLPLAALLVLGLRRNRSAQAGESLLADLGRPVPAKNLAGLVAIPAVATGTYCLINAAGWLPPSHQIVAVVGGIVGTVLFVTALFKLFLATSGPCPARETATSPAGAKP